MTEIGCDACGGTDGLEIRGRFLMCNECLNTGICSAWILRGTQLVRDDMVLHMCYSCPICRASDDKRVCEGCCGMSTCRPYGQFLFCKECHAAPCCFAWKFNFLDKTKSRRIGYWGVSFDYLYPCGDCSVCLAFKMSELV